MSKSFVPPFVRHLVYATFFLEISLIHEAGILPFVNKITSFTKQVSQTVCHSHRALIYISTHAK